MKRRNAFPAVGLFLLAGWCPAQTPGSQPAAARLRTRWAKEVSAERAWPEYPRPQMVRERWISLNGTWQYAIVSRDAHRPTRWDGEILVPFCVESALSGVGRRVEPGQALWYRRSFARPPANGRLLLHFDAVDWQATVWINGRRIGEHRGGYDAFTFDITDALGEGPQELVVRVCDPTDAGPQPRGKQVLQPRGIWYSAVTGIWQSVWLEPVPAAYIRSVRITPDVDAGVVRVVVQPSRPGHVTLRVSAGDAVVASARGPSGQPMTIPLGDAHLWSPADPFLYDLDVRFSSGDSRDHVTSYFGMRKIEVRADTTGVPRLWLNNRVLFAYGTLDQGWWPDGLYTAPTDEALRYDIEVTRRLGFNTIRKHVKVEPDRWYTWCDRLGLLVWQDMPSGDAFIRPDMPDMHRSPDSAAAFETELRALIDGHYNHPSIIMWVPYNEGWGQWDTPRICARIKAWDPTRLVDNASGWADRALGDVHDIHRYPGPAAPAPEPKRAAVLGEFGGLALPIAGHTWQDQHNWGYRTFKSRETLTDAYVGLLGRLRPLITRGLAAAIYTQTTDVETEVNGLMTYDRAIIKMNPQRIAAAARTLYQRPPRVVSVVPTSETTPQTWRYTTTPPGDAWFSPDFDDAGWARGPGGFGTPQTPGAVVRTSWTGADLWIRRTFQWPRPTTDTTAPGSRMGLAAPVAAAGTPQASAEGEVALLIHHDEDAEVYVNGRLAAKLTGYTTTYQLAAIDAAARRTLHPGRNVLAIHCHQTTGGQYIDAGIVVLKAQ